MDLISFTISLNVFPFLLTGVANILYGATGQELTNVPTDIHPDTKIIALSFHRIQSIPSYSFVNLTKCAEIRLQRNIIDTIHSYAFQHLPRLTKLLLHRNQISQIELFAFGSLPGLLEIELDNNMLTVVRSDNFKRLSNLKKLMLYHNRISVIEPRAFENLINLCELLLSNNKLIMLKSDTFVGLVSLNKLNVEDNNIKQIECGTFSHLKEVRELKLSRNNISKIGVGAFAFVYNNMSLPCDTKFRLNKRYIHIQRNSLLNFTWKLFVYKPFAHSEETMIKSLDNVDIHMHTNKFSCDLTLCWMIQGLDEGWFHAKKYYPKIGNPPHVWMGLFSVQNTCYDKLSKECPPTDRCMSQNVRKCIDFCTDRGYHTGTLSMKDFICPFKYYCDCTCLNSVNCTTKCAKEGKIDKGLIITQTWCKMCNCQCAIPNCKLQCLGGQFQIVTNTFGCLDCNCTCPDVDCDAQCGGKGFGMQSTSIIGCKICTGCKHEGNPKPKPNLRIIIPIVLGLVALLFPIGGIVMCQLKLKQNKEKAASQDLEISEFTESAVEIIAKHLEPKLAAEIRKCWIEPGGIEIEHLLGKGHIGVVWSATFKQKDKKINVAIKKLKGEHIDHTNRWTEDDQLKTKEAKMEIVVELDRQIVIDFLTEATVMRKFNHPNVLKVLGISLHKNKPCIVLPLMTNGNLKDFVKKKYSTLKMQELLAFVICVAQGMKHLSEHNFVHRDLAARNCMLDENLVVKVSDFGLTKDMDEKNYYRSGDDTVALPVRWMSIEAIQRSVFTSKSDVWSYGVVLWEVFSFGGLPYQDLENTEIEAFLAAGNRLHRPPLTPDYMYEAMLECWNEKPEERPTFGTIISNLDKYLDDQAEYMDMTESKVSDIDPDNQAKGNMDQ